MNYVEQKMKNEFKYNNSINNYGFQINIHFFVKYSLQAILIAYKYIMLGNFRYFNCFILNKFINIQKKQGKINKKEELIIVFKIQIIFQNRKLYKKRQIVINIIKSKKK